MDAIFIPSDCPLIGFDTNWTPLSAVKPCFGTGVCVFAQWIQKGWFRYAGERLVKNSSRLGETLKELKMHSINVGHFV